MQTHYLIIMNLHQQLMGAGNDLVLNYVDNNITSGSRGFQPARVSITPSRASAYRRASGQVEHFRSTWSQLESRTAWCVSGPWCALGQGVLPDPHLHGAVTHVLLFCSSELLCMAQAWLSLNWARFVCFPCSHIQWRVKGTWLHPVLKYNWLWD